MNNIGKKYKFPAYCFIDEITNQEELKKEEVTSPFVLFDNKTKSIFFINESIKNFLNLFCEPKSIEECCFELNTSLNQNEKMNKEDIVPFFRQMIKRGFLIPFEDDDLLPAADSDYIFGGYNIIKTLKSSEKEAVCIAIREVDNKKVVLKFLIPTDGLLAEERKKQESKFRQEFEIMAELNHPLICKIYDFDTKLNLAVLEYIEGVDLKELIKNRNISYNNKLTLIIQICEIISFLHEKNILHGDIHAKQFLVNSKLNVTLIDFGFSNRYSNLKNEMIKRGGISYYLEPENITPNAFKNVIKYEPNFKSEIYRLGVLFYFLIYEEYPFASFSWKALCKKIKKTDPIMMSKTKRGEYISGELLTVMKKMLSKQPELRYNSAIELNKCVKKICK